MASSFNRCIFEGNLTADPIINEVGENQVAKWSIAVNDTYRKEAPPLYIECECWRPSKVLDYMTKGVSILVEGRLAVDQWEKDGVRKMKNKLVVQTNGIQLLGTPKGGGSRESSLEEDFAGRF